MPLVPHQRPQSVHVSHPIKSPIDTLHPFPQARQAAGASANLHLAMRLPNAHRAVVDPSKVRDYLLSPSHPVGRFKATVFFALGYTSAGWEVLRDDLLGVARTGNAAPGQPSSFGQKYEVDAILTAPSGRFAPFRTVWILDAESEAPRFITAFPR